ncbi:MAG: hypothetical protein AVDCRST_MAG11-4165, partial [uncultured Gemmatimonadaceae bacterium]
GQHRRLVPHLRVERVFLDRAGERVGGGGEVAGGAEGDSTLELRHWATDGV